MHPSQQQFQHGLHAVAADNIVKQLVRQGGFEQRLEQPDDDVGVVVDEQKICFKLIGLAQQVHDELDGGALLRQVGEGVCNVQDG